VPHAPYIPAELLGVPTTTLQAWLLAAQTALNTLMIGKQAVEASYSEGSGMRTVRYNQANRADLRVYIQQLQAALGNTRTRHALPVRFG
jgi:hypothetical protein